MIAFPKPDDELRRRMVQETWHSSIRQAVDLDQVVSATEGCSFADLAELKKLLVLRFLDTHKWDWPWTLHIFRQDDRRSKPTRRVGFADPRLTNSRMSLDSILNGI